MDDFYPVTDICAVAIPTGRIFVVAVYDKPRVTRLIGKFVDLHDRIKRILQLTDCLVVDFNERWCNTGDVPPRVHIRTKVRRIVTEKIGLAWAISNGNEEVVTCVLYPDVCSG